MKKRIVSMILMLALTGSILLPLTGCADSLTNDADLMKGIEADKGKSQVAQADRDLDTQNALVADFGIRLFQTGFDEGKNVLISPLSVLCALSMTANGAKENTLAQMEKVLGLSVGELNPYIQTYMEKLPEGDDYKLRLANSIWFTDDERFTVEKGFLQTNADYYGAGIFKTSFDNSAVDNINNWVKEKTEGMIPRILDKIPPEAVMYLVNALTFDAQWQEIYWENQVRDEEFTLEDGTKRNVELMYSEENCYLEDEKATGFIKYYKDSAYAFVALLPKEGISVADYVATLTGEHLLEMISNPQEMPVNAAIPKFESEYGTEMSELLQKMGMTDAFDMSKADFTGLGKSTAGNIFISRILHKTFISVGEQGTKAGAATLVEVSDECAPITTEEPKIVYLNRPFFYMLIDCERSLPLFIGTVMNAGDAKNTAIAENGFESANMALEIPEGWNYSIDAYSDEKKEFSISFWPEEYPQGKIRLCCFTDGFGVCGTGLSQETVVFDNGLTGSKGTYDNNSDWTFIALQDLPGDYVFLNEGAQIWWDEYGEEAMSIMNSARLAKN